MPPEHRNDADDAAIREVMDAITAALRARDGDVTRAHCRPDHETFDRVPPLRHTDAEALRNLWTRTLASFDPPLEYDLEGISITAAGDVAFDWCLSRFGGSHVARRLRSTFGFRKVDGRWRLVHEHIRVRTDTPSGQMAIGLRS